MDVLAVAIGVIKFWEPRHLKRVPGRQGFQSKIRPEDENITAELSHSTSFKRAGAPESKCLQHRSKALPRPKVGGDRGESDEAVVRSITNRLAEYKTKVCSMNKVDKIRHKILSKLVRRYAAFLWWTFKNGHSFEAIYNSNTYWRSAAFMCREMIDNTRVESIIMAKIL